MRFMGARQASLTPRWFAGALALMLLSKNAGAQVAASSAEVCITPSEDGAIGAFLAEGPSKTPMNPARQLSRSGGAKLVVSGDGPIDLAQALGPATNAYALVQGIIRIPSQGRYHLVLGVDDGVQVFVDDKEVYARDEPRPFRPYDDLVALDLGAGEHRVTLRMHQRDGAWLFRLRLLDAQFAPPNGACLRLPGTTVSDQADLVERMSWVSVDRGASIDGTQASVTVRYPEGAPGGSIIAAARALGAGGKGPALFAVPLGEVPTEAGVRRALVAHLPPLSAQEFADADLQYEISVGRRRVKAMARSAKSERPALQAAALALRKLQDDRVQAGTRETLALGIGRVQRAMGRDDSDLEGRELEASELRADAEALLAGADVYATKLRAQRRGYKSRLDDSLHELGLYVPPSYQPGSPRRYPLVVALHGLNGLPMAMLRWTFGQDDDKHEQPWEERRTQKLPPLEAFVVAPEAFGNSMYRDLGEADVDDALRWVMARYPVDADRITITGPSMGGIGTLGIALKNPDQFAAAAPLCGYHSYFVRRDIVDRPLRPWETFLAQERSNVFWADNGQTLPLWVVHGTLDTPVENSQVLIDRYAALNFPLRHDHPALGHNVWQWTYEGLRGARWLTAQRRSVARTWSFRTTSARRGRRGPFEISVIAQPGQWAELRAAMPAAGGTRIDTRNVAELRVDTGALAQGSLEVDGQRMELARDAASAAVTLRRTAGTWRPDAPPERPEKRARCGGPLRDVFQEPLIFVYGTQDATHTRVNEEVARAWARVRPGVTARYRVLRDTEWLAEMPDLAPDQVMFLVGDARSNAVVRALGPKLPISVDGSGVHIGAQHFAGDVGAAFVYPNPRRHDRCIVQVAGSTPLSTLRSLSLPDLLPDFVVYDNDVARSAGQILLGAGRVLAAGFFSSDWSLPIDTRDPLFAASRPAPKTEYEATPYLP
jgi:poly(3-hydroxybutyrate) depolymerase